MRYEQDCTMKIKPHTSPLSPVSVVSAIVHEKGKVLLILRGKQPFKNKWSLPGGRQDFGELLKDAALRELKEETSLVGQGAIFERVYEEIMINADGFANFHVNISIFKVDNFTGTPNAADDAADVMWATKGELQKLDMTPNTADIIKEILGDLLT